MRPMPNRVHFIPVGFDFDRLIFPISKGQLNAERVLLITHIDEDNNEDYSDDTIDRQAAHLSGNMAERLRNSFELIDAEVETIPLERQTLYEYEELYPMAFQMIKEELDDGNEVFVNISSMPRPVAFAFATAADSIVTEFGGEIEDLRSRVHTYYVSPERYLVLDMVQELRKEQRFLQELAGEEDLRVHDRLHNISELLETVEERGVTQGAQMRDDHMFVEFPASPGGGLGGFETKILRFLAESGPMASTSDLAEELAKEEGEEYDASYRSRVQYNVTSLEEKGYINREKVGNRLETSLSTMGRMWVETH